MVRASPGWITSFALAAVVAGQSPNAPDPFTFLGPGVLTASERARIDRGEALVKNLPAGGADVAVLAVSRTDATGERLEAWIRRIERLKAGPHVESIGRFSTPLRHEDLATLRLDDADLDDIRRCRVTECGVRLSEEEMAALNESAATAGDQWRASVQDGFRRLILARAETYLAAGLEGIAPYHDQDEPVAPAKEFEQLLARSAFLSDLSTSLVPHLRGHRPTADPGIESFLYWSKEDLGRKPIVVITDINIVRDRAAPGLDALILSKQVYASHYMTGSLALTAITTDAQSNQRYLVYLNQSRLDVFGGLFGGIVRSVIDRRLRGEAGEVVEAVRKRIESGTP